VPSRERELLQAISNGKMSGGPSDSIEAAQDRLIESKPNHWHSW